MTQNELIGTTYTMRGREYTVLSAHDTSPWRVFVGRLNDKGVMMRTGSITITGVEEKLNERA